MSNLPQNSPTISPSSATNKEVNYPVYGQYIYSDSPFQTVRIEEGKKDPSQTISQNQQQSSIFQEQQQESNKQLEPSMESLRISLNKEDQEALEQINKAKQQKEHALKNLSDINEELLKEDQKEEEAMRLMNKGLVQIDNCGKELEEIKKIFDESQNMTKQVQENRQSAEKLKQEAEKLNQEAVKIEQASKEIEGAAQEKQDLFQQKRSEVDNQLKEGFNIKIQGANLLEEVKRKKEEANSKKIQFEKEKDAADAFIKQSNDNHQNLPLLNQPSNSNTLPEKIKEDYLQQDKQDQKEEEEKKEPIEEDDLNDPKEGGD